MSLEAIAALLGHKSLAMTLVYARIADRTLADEYFNVSQRVEALYQNQALPADSEGPAMRRVRIEHRKMLGNGWCVRPIELDCTCHLSKREGESGQPLTPCQETLLIRPMSLPEHGRC